MPIEKSGDFFQMNSGNQFFFENWYYETRKRNVFSHFEKRITNWLNSARKENHKNFLLWTTMPSQFWLCFVWIGVSFLGFQWIKITITLSIGLSAPNSIHVELNWKYGEALTIPEIYGLALVLTGSCKFCKLLQVRKWMYKSFGNFFFLGAFEMVWPQV